MIKWILIIFIIFLFIPLTAEINFKNNLYGFKFNIKFLLLNIKKDYDIRSEKKKTKKDYYNIKQIDFSKLDNKVINEIMSYICKKINVSKFKWSTNIGTNDACTTAITTGIFIGIKEIIRILVCEFVNTKDINFSTTPIYCKYSLDNNINLNINFNIFNIITIAIKFVSIIKRK